MSRRCGPDLHSVAWRMLAALDAAPLGAMNATQLLQLLEENKRTAYQLQLRSDALQAWGLARQLRGGLQIQPQGRAYLQAHRDKVAHRVASSQDAALLPVVPTSMATPRAVPTFKPLDAEKLMRGGPQRDGMNDLRAAPSLIGSVRVVRASNLPIKGVA